MAKILIFHHYNSSLGAGLSLLHILESLDKNNNSITVCIPNVEGDLAEKIRKMGIRVIFSKNVISYMHFSGNKNAFFSKAHLNNIKAIKQSEKGIREVIVTENPDIVVVNSMTLFWIGKIAKSYNIDTVCFNRETYRKGLLGIRSSYIKKALGEYFDVVAFLSNYDLKQTPIRNAKFVRVTDKVDVSVYESLSQKQCRIEEKLPKEAKLLLYTGGMAKLKGPKTLVKALAQINDKNIKVVFLQYTPICIKGIIGKIKNLIKIILHRNLQHELETYIKRHGLEDRVLFRPATDEVERYFVACDAVVFPCHDPHQARPIYEAGIARRPIIISDFPNYREFVDETNGWLFPPDHAGELAKRISDVFSKDSSEKVENNYKRSVSNNNLTTMKNELNEVFKLLDRKN